MNVSQPVFHGQVLFSSVCHKLSKAFQKVLVDHGVSPDVFIAGSPINQYLEFPTHEDVDEFCKAVCLAFDEQDETTFRGNFRYMDDAEKALREVCVENSVGFHTEVQFAGPTHFVRSENYVEFIRPAKARYWTTVVKKTSINLDGKIYTNTEESIHHSSWYKGLPSTGKMNVKPYFRVCITSN
jgi:hypothetical protein